MSLKNPELKSTIIQETPWLRDAQSETEQKKRVASLFDLNNLSNQLQIALTKLQGMQLSSGGFAWFSGSTQASRYITQHVASGFGQLKHLGIEVTDGAQEIKNKAVAFLDGEIESDYDHLLEEATAIRTNAKTIEDGAKLYAEFMIKQHLQQHQIQYLYMRTFFQILRSVTM